MLRPAALAVVAALAVDAADQPSPLLSIAIADGAEVAAHWQASLHGRLWADPALAPLRERFAAQVTAIAATHHLNLDVLSTSAKRIRLAAMPSATLPTAIAGVDLGGYAAPVLSTIAADMAASDAVLPAADAAFGRPGQPGIVARYGSYLVFTTGSDDPRPGLSAVAAPATGIDLALTADVPAITAVLRAEAKNDPAATAVLATLDRFGPLTATLALTPDGIAEQAKGSLRQPIAGFLPVDRRLLARLPATTLIMAAAGIDGDAWWAANRSAILAAVAEAERTPGALPLTEAQAEQTLDGEMAGMGIPLGLGKILAGAKGTALVAVTQGIPFPGITIAVPRSPGTDTLAAWICRLGAAQVPAPGATALLSFRQLPLPASLVCDAGHWLLTTDPVLAGQWVSAQPGGFADAPAGRTALGHAPAGAVLIGASDTPNVLRTASGYLSLALNAMELDPPQQQQVLGAINRLSGIAATGSCSLSLSRDAWAWESRGVIGGLVTGSLAVVPLLTVRSTSPAAPMPIRPASGTEF